MRFSITDSEKDQITTDPVAAVRTRIQGQVITPQDPQYDKARLAWNLTVNQHPVLIVMAASAVDVSEAVQFACRENLGVAVQSTGHGITLPADGGVLIITSRLNQISINAAAQTARIGAGLEWGEVLQHTQDFGLAPLLGSSPGVGVVGYTLGGGLGWLGRKYGLAADSVLSFELVNADGQLLCANATENPELFWGLRGGGGSFGVITSMEIRLYPVETVYAGNLIYPVEDARAVMQRYRDWIRTVPDELTSSVVMMNYPPIPQVPEPLRGKSFVMLRGCYTGPVEKGQALLQSWRDWKKPLIDAFQAMPFREAGKISNDPIDPMPSHGTGAWLRELSDGAIDTLIQHALPQGGPPLLIILEVRHAGGAISRVDPAASAYSHRDAELVLFCIGAAPDADTHSRLSRHLDQMKMALQPSLTGGVYMNFLEGLEARRRTSDGYHPEAYQRLRALKAQVDPQDRFCFSYNLAGEKG